MQPCKPWAFSKTSDTFLPKNFRVLGLLTFKERACLGTLVTSVRWSDCDCASLEHSVRVFEWRVDNLIFVHLPMVLLHGETLQMKFGRHLRWKKQVAKSSPGVKYVKFVALMFEADIPPNVSHLELQHVRNVLGSIWVKQLSHFHNTRFQGFVCNFF